MAILIPNMEIPETCSDCSFQYDCIQCNITGTNFWDKAKEVYFDFTRDRLPDCPLIEIADNTYFFSDKDKPLKITLDGSYEVHELNDTGDIEIKAYDTEEYLIELYRKYGGG